MTDALNTWARHQTALRTLREVLDGLHDAGVPALPVKGILTAHLLYEDVAERPISDIDIRIPRRLFRRLLAVSRQRGWRPRIDSPRLWEAVLHLGEWTIDVECTVGPPGLCALPVDAMVRRAKHAVQPLGFAHLEPELHDHALLLVLNAFKDGLHVMPWAVKDLLRIAQQPAFDPAKLVERAREGRVASALWSVAEWLRNEHNSRTWATVLATMRNPPSRRVVSLFDLARARGWNAAAAVLLTASSNDAPTTASWGLALAIAGVARGRINRRSG